MNRRALLISGLIASSLLCTSNCHAAQGVQTLAYQLTHVDQGEPFFSPDGKKVVYETTVAGFQQIFIMNADGTGATQITHDAVTHDSPSWSPDGKMIAFVSDNGKQESICIMNEDGCAEQCLTDKEHKYIHPNWSG